jgi:hypothetical protein
VAVIRVTIPTRSLGSAGGAGCALGVGLTGSGCAGGLTGVELTATFALGLAFSGDTRGKGAFFAGFFLIVLVFLAVVVFLRLAALATGVFLRFALPLAFFLVATRTSLDAHWILSRPAVRWAGGLSNFLERISRTQHGTILPMPPDQHHADGQSCGDTCWDRNRRMASDVEGASIGKHFKRPRHVYLAAGIGWGKGRGLQRKCRHEQEIHAL